MIITGIILVLGGALLGVIGMIAKNKILAGIVAICMLWGSGLVASGLNEVRFMPLTKEVSLRQVSVVGEDIFEGKIRISYKDGKLISVVLIPNTTVKAQTP